MDDITEKDIHLSGIMKVFASSNSWIKINIEQQQDD